MCDLEKLVDGVRSALEITSEVDHAYENEENASPVQDDEAEFKYLLSDKSGRNCMSKMWQREFEFCSKCKETSPRPKIEPKKGPWSEHEDDKLYRYFEKCNGDLNLLIKRIPDRTRSQIKQRCLILRLI